MNYYIFSQTINLVAFAAFGLLVYLGNRRNPLNRSFTFFAFLVCAWVVPYIFWQLAADANTALLWLRILMIGAIFIPVSFLQTTTILLGIDQQKKKLIYFFYTLFSIFLLSNLTPLFIAGATKNYFSFFSPIAGPAFHFFLFSWGACSVYTFYLLWQHYQSATGILRKQILYFLIGIVVGLLGGSTNYLIWYGIPFPPIGNPLVGIAVVLWAYAVLKHHLFNLKVIVAELLTFGIWILFLSRILFSSGVSDTGRIIDLVLFPIVIVFGVLLVRSVFGEVKQREQLEDLTQHLQQKVEEQTGEIRKAYEVEKRARLEIEALAKAKDQFILTTQHHLRTPLTIFRGFLNKVLENQKNPIQEEHRQDLQKASGAAERMNHLINDFLDITQLEIGQTALNLQPINLQKVITEIHEDLLPELEKKNLVFEADFSEAAVAVSFPADYGKIKIALYNLIDNAIKYTETGKITIQADVITHPIEHLKAIRIIIQDTGIGIPPEELPQIFHLYFQRGQIAEKVYTTGRGIGLTLAKGIIDAHRGRISAESEGAGKGARFTVELPL
ncbi:MAG TPA: ATP-binding protein [Candidatus Paceibacterota bacterium]